MLRYLAALTCLLFASCFELREEITIDKTGGALIEVQCTMPTRALIVMGSADELQQTIQASLELDGNLHLEHLEVTESGSDSTLNLKLKADSVQNLAQPADGGNPARMPAPVTELIGTISTTVEKLSIDFARTIHVSEAIGIAAFGVSPADRTDKQLTHIIHLPTFASEHNATRTENGGRTLIWEHPLGEALEQPLQLNFVAPLPVPWGWIIAIAVVLAVGVSAWRAKRKAGNPAR